MPSLPRLVFALLALVTPVVAAADAPTAEGIAERLATFNTYAHFPLPVLSDHDLGALVEGDLVRIRDVPDDSDEPQRVMALQVVDQRKEVLWVAARDAHYSALDSLIEQCLCPDPPNGNRWYQLLDLPRPFADRHWVIDVWDNHDLSKATDGAQWEHPWQLVEDGPALATSYIEKGEIDGVTPSMGEKAVYTPMNQGAWIAISLPDDKTLLAYHVRSVIGGAVPDRLVADYTIMTFGKVYRGILQRVPDAMEHYDGTHAPMIGGDGTPIPPFTD